MYNGLFVAYKLTINDYFEYIFTDAVNIVRRHTWRVAYRFFRGDPTCINNPIMEFVVLKCYIQVLMKGLPKLTRKLYSKGGDNGSNQRKIGSWQAYTFYSWNLW